MTTPQKLSAMPSRADIIGNSITFLVLLGLKLSGTEFGAWLSWWVVLLPIWLPSIGVALMAAVIYFAKDSET